MPADALLSDLCGICYTEQPKYRCPGCNAKTCSVPCYKKHQQRASCTGKRNPAAYLKKSQWTTPAAIDRDYNYLRSVERAIEQGNSTTPKDDPSPAAPTTLKNVIRGRHPDSRLQKYLSQHAITVENAPIGMSRQKTNQTRPTKKNNIVWTIEWILPEQEIKHIEHDCLETTSISALYASSPLDTQSRGTKRKRENDHLASSSSSSSSSPSVSSPSIVEKVADAARIPHTTRTENVATDKKFYLLRPLTTSNKKVLVPIDANASVTEMLKGRTVLEFPTLYVFSSLEEGKVPDGFMLEEEYSSSERKDGEEKLKDAWVSTASSNKGTGRGGKEEVEEEVDADAILEMLRRDVRR